MFSKAKTAELLKKFAKVEINDIKDAKLRAQATGLKAKQGGFTLLELLVVVAILAAIAGTASIALNDTDARASAAAHVAMMDELNKGIRTYRVLRKNELPTRFDSLLQAPSATANSPIVAGDVAAAASVAFVANRGFDPADGLAIAALDDDILTILSEGGITDLQYVNTTYNSTANADYIDGVEDCGTLTALVSSRKNAVVAGNVFMSPRANGCGDTVTIPTAAASTLALSMWTGGTERLTGQPQPAGTLYNANGQFAYMAVGIGPSSSLFDTNALGGMTTVPVYRHVSENEYNRFIAVFNVGTYDSVNGGTDGIVPGAQADLVAIIDGALDTKEEELGEWDGTRNTI